MHPLRTLLALISIIASTTHLAAEATQSDLDTQRLLDISKREQKIYQQIAADPEWSEALGEA